MSHPKFKCLIISTNRERLPVPVIPHGVCLIAAELEESGFDVQVLDLAFLKEPVQRLISRKLSAFAPDVICLSIRNIDNANCLGPIFYLKEVKSLVQAIKSQTRAPVVVGGSAFNISPEAILNYLGADFGIWGDGEHALVNALQGILQGMSSARLQGLVVKGQKFDENTAFRLQELRGRTDKDIFSWIPIKQYLRMGANLPVQTKRGCPKKCIYCTYNNIEGPKGRFKEPAEVAGEAAYQVKSYHPKVIEFVDSIFNVPQSHAIQVCEALARKRLPVEFEVSSISAGDVSLPLFESLKQAGFNSAIITPDSASDVVLRELNKGFGVSEVVNAAEYAKKVSLPVLWSFIVGGPGETKETVLETFRFIREKIGKKDVAFMVFGVRIYPGTQMAERAIAEAVVSMDDDLLEPKFYFSPALEKDDLIRLVKEQARGITNLITVADNQHPLVEKLAPLARLLPGPIWRYSRWLRIIRSTLS
ncbi:MAG TPA: radical SAM protein [Thermodesulfovibrionia bacterium]|nr:radical SAM protein [Thermodesulfovibrionia bacterium]